MGGESESRFFFKRGMLNGSWDVSKNFDERKENKDGVDAGRAETKSSRWL